MKTKTQWIFCSAILIVALLLGGYQAVKAQQPPAPTIVSFTSVLRAVTVAEAESFAREATLKWRTSGMAADYHLTLHEYQQNSWVAVPDAAGALFAEKGECIVTVKHPQNFGPPMFLLSIVDSQGRVIDQRTVVLRYDLPAELPAIEAFTANISAVDARALAAGNMMVELDWTIRNRPPTANPLFTQVFDDGSAVLVELPRPNPWIPSVWHGPVKPVWRNGLAAIRLRMELVDQVSGGIYTQAEVLLPVVSGPVSPAVPSPAIVEPPTEVPAEIDEIAGPEIISFTVTPDNAALGSPVTLAWEVRGTDGIFVTQWIPETVYEESMIFISNSLHGSTTVNLPKDAVDSVKFVLWTTNREANAQVEVHGYCADTVFFGSHDGCPDGPSREVAGAYLAFEYGIMVWDGELGLIHVFFEDGTAVEYYESSYLGLPESDPNKVPPDGRFVPIRGFGRLWANEPGLADKLGWALDTEEGYTITKQQVAGGAFAPSPDYITSYLTLPDGRIVSYIFGESWHFVR